MARTFSFSFYPLARTLSVAVLAGGIGLGAAMESGTGGGGLASLGALLVPQAHAQSLGGGGQGQGSGGTSDGTAGPRGAGSGGTTAGAGTGGGSGATTSTGPGSVNQNRYGGRAATPPPPPLPDDEVIADILDRLQSSAPQGGESVDFDERCAYVRPAVMTPDEQLSGANLQWLVAAQYVLAPNFDPEGARTPLLLLANYQEEIAKRDPDPRVAASYLALTATRPVTVEVVAQVNTLLCVTTTRALAEEIAAAAEAQRQASS